MLFWNDSHTEIWLSTFWHRIDLNENHWTVLYVYYVSGRSESVEDDRTNEQMNKKLKAKGKKQQIQPQMKSDYGRVIALLAVIRYILRQLTI